MGLLTTKKPNEWANSQESVGLWRVSARVQRTPGAAWAGALALIAGLGLHNATAPHFVGRMGQAPSTQPIHSAPAAQAPVADGDAAMGSGADA